MRLWLILVVIVEFIADVLAKSYASTARTLHMAGALLFYMAATALWLTVLRDGMDLGRGIIIFSVLSAAMGCFVGLVLFGETLTRTQWFGIFLGLLSVYLLGAE